MAKKLTAMQAEFVRHLRRGLRPTEAAAAAGSLAPSAAATGWLKNPGVLQAIHDSRNAMIQGELSHLALETMRNLMRKEEAPPATRFQAAQWVLKAAGHGTDDGQADRQERKDLADMDAAELAEAVQAGRQALESLASRLTDHHIVDGQARQLIDVPGDQDAEEDLAFLE